MNITICGAGNAAHTLVPLLASSGEHAVTVYAPMGDEATRWSALLDGDQGVAASMPDGHVVRGRPLTITADPLAASTQCQLLLLALPAFAHEPVLRALAPTLPGRAWIGALPARGGFNWMVQDVLPTHEGVIFGLQTLPWACRISRWGLEVEVMGAKAAVDLAAAPTAMTADVASALAPLLAVPMTPASNFLALTLANTGQLIHPGIMYGLFHDWDGVPFSEQEVPLFYGGVDDGTTEVLQALSDEVQNVRHALEQRNRGMRLDSVVALDVWLRRAYPTQIADTTSLRSAFVTNRAYAGLRAPVLPAAQAGDSTAPAPRYVPAFNARYLAEDVPYGLLVTRGIAELAGVHTPMADRVILWAQERLQRNYLVDGRLAGPDVIQSRAPQRFGLGRPEDLQK